MYKYWLKQGEVALFAELEWNKPERRDHASHILVVGGHLHALGAPAKAYEVLEKTGKNNITLVLPDSTKKLIGSLHETAVFLPSTPSGELSVAGAIELETAAANADLLLLPGDTGRNSQTTQLLEQLLSRVEIPAVITKDSLDTLIHIAPELIMRPDTTLVTSVAQLQKLALKTAQDQAITFQMNLEQLATFLHHFSEENALNIVTMYQNQLVVASHGMISTTKLTQSTESTQWRVAYAALAANYVSWNRQKPFESLTQSAFLLQSVL